MFKEFMKKKLVELLEIDKLTDKCVEADISNQGAVSFLLSKVKVDDKFFEPYRWKRYIDLPWYIKELFGNKYNITYKYDTWVKTHDIYYNGNCLIAFGEYPLARIIEYIKAHKVKVKQSKGKK